MSKKFYILLTAAYIAVCAWLVVVHTTEGQTHWVSCPSKLLYHIPCPGCGVTRATLLFLQGECFSAIRLNPNVLLSVIFLLGYPCLLCADRWMRRGLLPDLYLWTDRMLHKKTVLLAVLGFELLVWISNIIRGI